MNEELSFEISSDCTKIEIHGNEEGLKRLIEIIEKVIEGNSHDHLMTPFWGGNELSEEAKGNNTKIINKVTIGIDKK